MLSMSSSTGFDSDNIHSILAAPQSKDTSRLPSDMPPLLSRHDFPFRTRSVNEASEFHLYHHDGEDVGHQVSIRNHYQKHHNISSPPSSSSSSSFVFCSNEKSSSTQSMSILGSFVPSYSSSDMYPMYQSSHVPRRHSTIDSTNGGESEYKSTFGLSLPSSPSSAIDMDFENKFTQMNHFENSPIYHNSFSSKGGSVGAHFHDMGPSGQDGLQPFHSIKPNNQTPFYSESNSLLSLPKKISLYKTELCRTFEETGFCRYGVKCQFAHDKSELRIIPRHPRYKTEICRTFWELGNCPYGKRCCFIHLEAGTLMNGKPPGQAKIGSDNQFNGPVYQGFQKDLLVKSHADVSSASPFPEPSEHHVNSATNHNLSSLLSNSTLSSTSSSPSSILSTGEANFAAPIGFDWMRTRRSQSLSLPSSNINANREFKGVSTYAPPSFSSSSSYLALDVNDSLESSKEFDIYAYDTPISVTESNDYLCENCSKDSNDLKTQLTFNSLSCKISVFGAEVDESNHSCNINIERESTESIVADSLLASLPDY